MRHIAQMVDMKRTPEEQEEAYSAPACTPSDYPYGLCICLTQDELDKLDLDDDVQVGDMIHLFAMAKVTSISKRDNEATGPDTRIELQITHIATEDEDEEDAEDPQPRKSLKSFYGE